MYGVEKKQDACTFPPITNSEVLAEYNMLVKEQMAEKGMLGQKQDNDLILLESVLMNTTFTVMYPNVVKLIKIKLLL